MKRLTFYSNAISFYTLIGFLFFLCPHIIYSQGEATNDTVCILFGSTEMFDITLNDLVLGMDPRLEQPNECFELKEGQLKLLPNADERCCGVYDVYYSYPGTQIGAMIQITIKCPKPDCSLVELVAPRSSAGDGQKNIFYACENSLSTYFIDHVPGNTYSWNVTGGLATILGPGSIDVQWGADGSGIITVGVSNGAMTETKTFCFEILDAPIADFLPLQTCVCLNSPISFQNNSLGGNSYLWDFGDGNTSTVYEPTHEYSTPGTYAVTLSVTGDNYDPKGDPLCCCTDSVQYEVIVDDKPGPEIYWISTLCEGDSTKYWTDIGGCDYIWSVFDASGSTVPFIDQGNDTICVVWGAGPLGTVTLQLDNCTGDFCEKPVTALVPIISVNGTIAGPIVVCAGSSETYTLPKWPSVDYQWMVMGGTIASGQGTNSLTVNWGGGPTGMVKADYGSKFLNGLPNHNGDDCYGTAKINVDILPKYNVFNPKPVVCVNETISLSTDMGAILGFTWEIAPAVAPFPYVGVNTISFSIPNAGTYVVKVYPNNPNLFCNDTVFTVLSVIDIPSPDSIAGDIEICPGETYLYAGVGSSGGTGFNWSITGGDISSFTGNPVSVTWDPIGPYILKLSQFLLSDPFCSSDTISLVVNPKEITGPLSISGIDGCSNEILTYTLGPLQHPDATYLWTIEPDSAGSVILGATSLSADIQWNNDPGPVTIKAFVNLCGEVDSASLIITLNAPDQPIIVQKGMLCPGVTDTLEVANIFCNYLWSTGETSFFKLITTPGVFSVTTTDCNGCKAIDSYEVFALDGPNAEISTPDITTLCINPPNSNDVTLYALTNPNYVFQWYCNGTAGGTTPTLVHTNTNIDSSFTYNVIVTDTSTGCINSSNPITVNQIVCSTGGTGVTCKPQAYTFAIDTSQGSPNCNEVTFNVNSTNVTIGSWAFGDPGGNAFTGTISNPKHIYSKAGYFLATLGGTVPNSNTPPATCSVSASIGVCIPLAADFDYTINCMTTQFTDFSTYLPGRTIVSWSWMFGDGNTSSLQNPSHPYLLGGPYIVKLTVTDNEGCKAERTIPINVYGPPSALFSMIPSPVCVGESVSFTPATLVGINSFLWDFDDGSTNGDDSPKHAYSSNGTFNVSLTVTDINGCTATEVLSLIVHPLPPMDTIAYSPSLTICEGDTVMLTAPLSNSYLWNNGATSQKINVTIAGEYSVTVTDINNCKLVPASVVVNVIKAPLAIISGKQYICDNECVTLNANMGFGYQYQWLGATGSAIPFATNSSYIICAGNYQIQLYVQITDANGCTTISPAYPMFLDSAPLVGIVLSAGSGCEGDNNLLNVTPILGDASYQWSTGDTGTGIIVTAAGTYTVIATDTLSGCSSSASFTIHPLPDLCFVPVGCYTTCNPDTLCGPEGLAMYQWNMNGAPIAGATQMWLEVTQSGSYTLTGTNSFGCSVTSDSLIITVIECCEDEDTEVTASSLSASNDSCCWALSYNINNSQLYGMSVHTTDAQIIPDFSSLDLSLNIIGTSSHTVNIANSTLGSPLPTGSLNSFMGLCFKDITSSPIQVIVNWYGINNDVLCQDTLLLDCIPEPPCAYAINDTIYCKGDIWVHEFEICNPASNTFSIGNATMNIFSPAIITATPSFFDFSSMPILPGDCRTVSVVLSGSGLANDTLCYNISVHNADPSVDPDALCCTLDTIYCLRIPGCDPCDVNSFISEVIDIDECCYEIGLINYSQDNFFDGIDICVLTSKSEMNLTNFFGSGWSTTSLSTTTAFLKYNDGNGYIPTNTAISLPPICITASISLFTEVEIKWKNGDQVVCRDTLLLRCKPECGYLVKDKVECVNQQWAFSANLVNNSAFTMTDASVSFEDPALSAFGQSFSIGSLLPGGSYGLFTIPIGAPAKAGDTLCMYITLHTSNHDIAHKYCCNFKALIVLPECDDDCPPVLVVTGTDVLTDKKLSAQQGIETSGEVKIGTDRSITFQAGNSIILNPNFSADVRCTFVAQIADCPSPTQIKQDRIVKE